jgi:hypothetical protein
MPHNIKDLLHRVARLGRRVWGYVPFSLPGLALALAIAAGAYFLGMKRSDHILLITGGAVLLLALVDMLFVVATALFMGWRFRKHSDREISGGYRLDLTTGIPAPSARQMPKVMPPLIEASTHILNPPDFQCEWKRNDDGTRQEWLIPGRRCELEESFKLRRRMIVKDVLGFFTLDWEQEEPLSLRVLPRPLPLGSQSLIRAWFQGDEFSDPRGEPTGDRVDMRRYSPGDPPRLLLWKIYARTGKLMVRVPEAAVTTAPRTCAYLVAGPGDETVASLARTLVESNLLGDGWRFGADGSAGSVDKKEEALRLIARSGNPDVVSGDQLGSFLKEQATRGFGACIVLVPAYDGEWVDTVAALLARSPLTISLLTVGSVHQPTSEPKWRKLVFYEETPATNPNDLFVRLNSSAVTDWLTFDPATRRLVALRGRSPGAGSDSGQAVIPSATARGEN